MAKLELIFKGVELSAAKLNAVVDQINALQPEWLRFSGWVNVKLVDAESIRALNKQYSGQDYATDVLSFSYIEDGAPQGEELGDIAINALAVRSQAKTAGIAPAEELAILGLHGILHIFGLDHAEAKEREAMDRQQAEILASANVTYRNFNWTQ